MTTKVPVRKVRNKDQAQALCGFLWNEKLRHLEDVAAIDKDLAALKRLWKVIPTGKREFVRVK